MDFKEEGISNMFGSDMVPMNISMTECSDSGPQRGSYEQDVPKQDARIKSLIAAEQAPDMEIENQRWSTFSDKVLDLGASCDDVSLKSSYLQEIQKGKTLLPFVFSVQPPPYGSEYSVPMETSKQGATMKVQDIPYNITTDIAVATGTSFEDVSINNCECREIQKDETKPRPVSYLLPASCASESFVPNAHIEKEHIKKLQIISLDNSKDRFVDSSISFKDVSINNYDHQAIQKDHTQYPNNFPEFISPYNSKCNFSKVNVEERSSVKVENNGANLFSDSADVPGTCMKFNSVLTKSLDSDICLQAKMTKREYDECSRCQRQSRAANDRSEMKPNKRPGKYRQMLLSKNKELKKKFAQMSYELNFLKWLVSLRESVNDSDIH